MVEGKVNENESVEGQVTKSSLRDTAPLTFRQKEIIDEGHVDGLMEKEDAHLTVEIRSEKNQRLRHANVGLKDFIWNK